MLEVPRIEKNVWKRKKKDLHDQISHGVSVMQVRDFCALFELKIDELLERTCAVTNVSCINLY